MSTTLFVPRTSTDYLSHKGIFGHRVYNLNGPFRQLYIRKLKVVLFKTKTSQPQLGPFTKTTCLSNSWSRYLLAVPGDRTDENNMQNLFHVPDRVSSVSYVQRADLYNCIWVYVSFFFVMYRVQFLKDSESPGDFK